MKRRIKILTILVSFTIVLSCFLVGCRRFGTRDPSQDYIHPDFVTAYTEEQHIQRITERTQVRFSKEIESGAIVNYTVEIVYAFYDNDPEYFLVNLEYAEEIQRFDFFGDLKYQTKYKHFLGYIENDEYYTGVSSYGGNGGDSMFIDGISAYELAGYATAKKYYGSDVFAVETKDGLLQIFEIGSTARVEFETVETRWEQRIIPETEYEDLMKNNYKRTSHVY